MTIWTMRHKKGPPAEKTDGHQTMNAHSSAITFYQKKGNQTMNSEVEKLQRELEKKEKEIRYWKLEAGKLILKLEAMNLLLQKLAEEQLEEADDDEIQVIGIQVHKLPEEKGA